MSTTLKDPESLIDSIVTFGTALLPLIVPSSAPAIEAGTRMIEMIDHAIESFDDDLDVSELERTRDAFEKQVNEDVTGTIQRLRGES